MEELLHPEWSAEKIEQLKGHYQSILSLLVFLLSLLMVVLMLTNEKL